MKPSSSRSCPSGLTRTWGQRLRPGHCSPRLWLSPCSGPMSRGEIGRASWAAVLGHANQQMSVLASAYSITRSHHLTAHGPQHVCTFKQKQTHSQAPPRTQVALRSLLLDCPSGTWRRATQCIPPWSRATATWWLCCCPCGGSHQSPSALTTWSWDVSTSGSTPRDLVSGTMAPWICS